MKDLKLSNATNSKKDERQCADASSKHGAALQRLNSQVESRLRVGETYLYASGARLELPHDNASRNEAIIPPLSQKFTNVGGSNRTADWKLALFSQLVGEGIVQITRRTRWADLLGESCSTPVELLLLNTEYSGPCIGGQGKSVVTNNARTRAHTHTSRSKALPWGRTRR